MSCFIFARLYGTRLLDSALFKSSTSIVGSIICDVLLSIHCLNYLSKKCLLISCLIMEVTTSVSPLLNNVSHAANPPDA